MNIELIEWLDSGLASDLGWASKERYLKDLGIEAMHVQSIGFVMHEDKDVVVLAQSWDPDHENFLGAHVIAKSNIIDRRVLTKASAHVEVVA